MAAISLLGALRAFLKSERMDFTNEKHEYMVHLWGGFFNEEYRAKHGREPGYYFFDTAEERDRFLAELRAEEQALGQYATLAQKTIDGRHVRYRTVAKMRLRYQGKEYALEHDFGHAYPVDSAHYMFEDGNYSCDCNRSLFLAEKHEGFPELDCGNEVQLAAFQVVQVRGSSGPHCT